MAVVVTGRAAAVLSRVGTDADLAVWQRGVPRAVAQAIDALPSEAVPSFRCETSARDLVVRFQALARDADGCPALRWVMADAARLASRYAALTGFERLAAKLERVTTDSCRFLHHDMVERRMVVTYRGRGTEWLPPWRESEWDGDRARIDSALLHGVPRFAVALFRGAASRDGGIWHRSPPIGGTGETRLVLTINERLRRTVSPPPPVRLPRAAASATIGAACA